MTTYTVPGRTHELHQRLLQADNLLISGGAGTGKTAQLHALVYTLLHQRPSEAGLILLDPSRSSLARYCGAPHCIRYASEPDAITAALEYAQDVADAPRNGMTYGTDRELYIIADDAGGLLSDRQTARQLARLMQTGRASGVHVIISARAGTIPTRCMTAFDARVALRTLTVQQSRALIGRSGCESLPDCSGEAINCGYVVLGASCERCQLPTVSDTDDHAALDCWKDPLKHETFINPPRTPQDASQTVAVSTHPEAVEMQQTPRKRPRMAVVLDLLRAASRADA